MGNKKKKFYVLDTPRHGYLKVSKAYLRRLGYDLALISHFSGMNRDYVFLEEDQDLTFFTTWLCNHDIEFYLECKYVRNMKHTHSFDRRWFDAMFEEGDTMILDTADGLQKYDISKNRKGKVFAWRHNDCYQIDIKDCLQMMAGYTKKDGTKLC